ncbi:DUF6518 family protein [Thermosediminibacter litoriperuensis]|uniref:Uncharacterized protein n=1 Tax=Thermosediminibacter litoriperuensis TaxID=291989 RepID=A0A5S5AGL6_9FIRM|nr:hypothetical protein LZ11_02395 [Thermosediminibacter litoriperuensis]
MGFCGYYYFCLEQNTQSRGNTCFCFFVGMLLTYYIYSMKLFGFFPIYYFIRWGLIALVSSLAAYLVWFSRGKGCIAALCAALPIGLLAAEGYSFLYTFSPGHFFDLCAALLLFCILPSSKHQYLKTLPPVIFIVLALRNFNILSYLSGGL